MSQDMVAVLDIGSSSVRIVVGKRGINGTFNILGKGESEYSGYVDGEFLDTNELASAINIAKINAETNSGMEIHDLFVGVPGEFSLSEVKLVSQNYPKKIKISQENINDLFLKADGHEFESTHTLISCSGIYFVLSDNRRVINPLGEKSSRLSASISYIWADNTFIEIINSILSEQGIQNCEYLSTPLAEGLYLLHENQREKYAIIIDCGYISTSVSLVRGKGLIMLNSFSLGGGHISADLQQCLHIPFASAEQLKSKVVLSISPAQSDVYEVQIQNKMVPVSMQMTNSIVCARIDMIASAINKCLNLCKEEHPEYIDVYLTGGGISYIRGAKDQLSKSIGRNVKLLIPKDSQMSKAYLSSTLGLLDMALEKLEDESTSFLQKLKSFLANLFKR
ncbi:MAG: cell division FtsA domain-containing protein [Christensenellales bacterium]